LFARNAGKLGAGHITADPELPSMTFSKAALALSALAVLAACSPKTEPAAAPQAPAAAAPAPYSFKIGALDASALLDGTIKVPNDGKTFGIGRPPAEVAAVLKAAGRTDVPNTSGLEEIFEEISPIEDLGETMQLSFTNPYLEPEKYSIEECKERGKTYAAPLYVEAEFMNHQTGEIKTQTVFMGDFPLQTGRGTFIINGTERVVVSQLVRSPGVYFDKTPDKTSDKDIVSARVIPSRGAWLEFEIDKRDQVGVRIDRKRKQSVTVFLKALGLSSEDILAEFAGYTSIEETLAKDTIVTKEDALRDIYRKLRPGEQVAAEAAPTEGSPA